jgi:NADH-quinone oxidoreductase subunit G
VNKYQQEVGGALRGGDPGVRLLNEKPGSAPVFFQYIADPFVTKQKKWFILPQYHVFGSAELAAYSPGIKEQSPDPYIKLSIKDAEELGVTNGSKVSIKIYEREYSLPVIIQNELSAGIVLVPIGLGGTAAMSWGSWITMEKVN